MCIRRIRVKGLMTARRERTQYRTYTHKTEAGALIITNCPLSTRRWKCAHRPRSSRMAGCLQFTSPLSSPSKAFPHCKYQGESLATSDAIERPISCLVFSSIALKSDTLAIPALLSASSALLLLLNFIPTRKSVEDEEERESPAQDDPRGFLTKLRRHATLYGGLAIFIWRILRLLAVLDLVGLAIITPISTKDIIGDCTYCAQFLNWSMLGCYVSIP